MDNEERINIIFVVPSLCRAGAETQAISLVNGVNKERFRKHIFTFQPNIDQIERIDTTDVTIHHELRKYKYDYSVPLRLSRIIDENSIEILHCTLKISLFIAWVARLLSTRKPRIVVALHSTKSRGHKERLLNHILYRWLLRSCEKIIYVCNEQKKYLTKESSTSHDRGEVIYNGVNVEIYNPDSYIDKKMQLEIMQGMTKSSFVFCCIAGFRKEKGHNLLIKAFALLAGEYDDVYLLFAGDGNEREEIKYFIDYYKLQERIHMLGIVKDVRSVLAISNVSVLASTAVETFSMAMLESMAMKVPVIASDIGGLSEAIENGVTGYLVPPGDVYKLKEVMKYMLENPEQTREMGNASRNKVVNEFSEKRMIEDTEKLLATIINSNE